MRHAAPVFLLGIALAAAAPLVAAAEEQTTYFLGDVRISAPNGQLVGAEELNPVSKAVYDILHAKLMPAPK